METRDGTPFMGLTTHDDGIPSIDGKTNKQTTNKRYNNCLKIKCTCNFIHFHPYSSSQFIFIHLTQFHRCTSCLNKSDQCTCKAAFVQKCKDCLHFAASPERHREHRREARHIHSYRNRAYR